MSNSPTMTVKHLTVLSNKRTHANYIKNENKVNVSLIMVSQKHISSSFQFRSCLAFKSSQLIPHIRVSSIHIAAYTCSNHFFLKTVLYSAPGEFESNCLFQSTIVLLRLVFENKLSNELTCLIVPL